MWSFGDNCAAVMFTNAPAPIAGTISIPDTLSYLQYFARLLVGIGLCETPTPPFCASAWYVLLRCYETDAKFRLPIFQATSAFTIGKIKGPPDPEKKKKHMLA